MGRAAGQERDMEIHSMEVSSMEMLAQRIWGLSRDRLLMNLRFLDVALSSLRFQARTGIGHVFCDVNAPQAAVIYYDPSVIIRLYKKDPANVTRLHLHILLHCIFSHSTSMIKWTQSSGTWRWTWRWRVWR